MPDKYENSEYFIEVHFYFTFNFNTISSFLCDFLKYIYK